MLSRLRADIAHLVASISNTKPVTPTNPQKTANNTDKLFIPTFESRASVIFWLIWVMFLTLYGLAIRVDTIDSIYTAVRLVFEFFVLNSMTVLFNIGFVQLSTKHYQQLTDFQISKKVIVNACYLTPLATVCAFVVLHLLVGMSLTWMAMLSHLIVNTVVTIIFMGTLLYYFSVQERQIRQQYDFYQQQLLEQNEQIKARTTPHFFFNMLNNLQQLIETNPYEAENMVRSVSSLYRVSFNGSQEIAFMDEIDICKHYLKIETYRFQKKLEVIWQLPDEDLLYDMTITSLTLQLAIEKIITFVLENSVGITYLDIIVTWEDDWITIKVNGNNLEGLSEQTKNNIDKNLSFNNQLMMLKKHYSEQASIQHNYTNTDLTITIEYPFKDVALL